MAQRVLIDHHIPHNKPNVLLNNKASRSFYVIDVANLHNNNIEQIYVEKEVNYEPLGHSLVQTMQEYTNMYTWSTLREILDGFSNYPTMDHHHQSPHIFFK